MTSALSDVGAETKEAALETLLWATVNAEKSRLTELLRLSSFPGALFSKRQEHNPAAVAFRAALVHDALTQGETMGAVQIVEHREFGPESALIRLKHFHADGKTTTEIVVLRRTPEGWKRDPGAVG